VLDTLHQPITTIARRAVACLDGRQSVAQALASRLL
jgi:magnesium transporter